MIKPSVSKRGKSWRYGPPDVIQWEVDDIIYIIFLPKMFTLNRIMTKQVEKCTMWGFLQGYWPGPFRQKRKPLPVRNKQKGYSCVCMCVYVRMCVVASICVYMHVCGCVHMYVWGCVYVWLCICVHVCVYTCVYRYVKMYVYVVCMDVLYVSAFFFSHT